MKYIPEHEAKEQYNEFLDEAYGEVDVAGYSYMTSQLLEEVDPIAWREGFLDWLDSENLTTDEDESEEEE